MDFPNASQPEILAAGIKYAFYFITGISVVGLIGSFFVKKPSPVTEKSSVAVKATEAVRS
jgi:MFS transporter, DHA2 family, lincomycin resistance protein